MTDAIPALDVVALLHDMPDQQLTAGQTGTVAYVHRGGAAFEVEFPHAPRQSFVATVERPNLLKLRGLTPAPALGS